MGNVYDVGDFCLSIYLLQEYTLKKIINTNYGVLK
jgi:hypothetical protein